MTKVKICGLMTERDVRIAGEADHLGFVVSTGTRRSLEPEAAARLMRVAGRPTVAVLTSSEPGFVNGLAHRLRPGAVQLNAATRYEDLEAIKDEAGCEVWAVVHIGPEAPCLDRELLSLPDRVVIDTASPQGGGSGRTHSLGFSAAVVRELPKPCSLAGGLNPENVAAAIARVGPDMVDVSSGVEVEGSKNGTSIKRFIEEVRGCH